MESTATVQVAPLYTQHAAAADRGGWSLIRDVRWGDIDIKRARTQPELLAAVREAALAISAHGVQTVRAMGAMSRDPHACAALTVDLYDGLKHFHALRTYLDTVDHSPSIDDAEVVNRRSVAEADATDTDTLRALVEQLLRQHLQVSFFRDLGGRAEEPVLAELLSFIAADEARHGQILSDLLALRIREDGTVATKLLEEVGALRTRGADVAPPALGGSNELALQTLVRRLEALCESAPQTATRYSSSRPFSRT